MHAIASSPGALRLFALSLVARLPLTMFSVGLLVHAAHLTGSFGSAGLVSGAYAVALGVGGPLLGQLVDRRGQTVVLVASAGAAVPLVGAVALLPAGAPLPAIVALAAGIGLATPPVGACVRTLFPSLLDEPAALRGAYAAEASASELTWIAGPPLALGLGALWSTGAALGVAGAVLAVATGAFAAQPASRAWRPAPSAPRQPGGSLRAPAMRTLVIALVAVGALFGAVEVAVTAAAAQLGSTAAAGPLLGVWGGGSLLGGLLATRLGGGAHGAKGLALMLAALTAGHLLLIPAAGSLVALAAALLVAGAAIAPTYATVHAMVEDAAPAGTATEAFAWLATAVAIGASAGAACAGTLADGAGPIAALALAVGAGALATITTIARAWTLPGPQATAPAAV